jgi:hypothetical protein
MDVGNNSFRFTLDDPEKAAKTIREPKSTELHVSSLDRFVKPFASLVGFPQSQDWAQLTFFLTPYSPSSDCIIQTKRALLYGYFSRLALTEFQLKWKVPTVVTGVNDFLNLVVWPANVEANAIYIQLVIPQGYYTPQSLAAYLQTTIQALGGSAAAYTVTAPAGQGSTVASGVVPTGFTFATNNTDTWAFPSTGASSPALTATQRLSAAKFGRLLGVGREASGYATQIIQAPTPFQPTVSFKTYAPNWFPTDYIDIVSKSLTNYKDSKDTNSTVQAPLGVIGRVYMTDFSTPQAAGGNNIAIPLTYGTSPITFTKKWYSPNWSLWSPNQSLDKIDIQLLDMWGQPIFWNSEYNTEWHMTILTTE